MRPSLPPCPECGGKCAFFSGSSPAIPRRMMLPIKICWYICLECEHTMLRIHPDDLEKLHRAAEKSEGKLPKPCPECGGERVAFKCSTTDNSSVLVCMSPGREGPVYLYWWACLQCGSVAARPHPKDTEKLRGAAKNKYVRFF